MTESDTPYISLRFLLKRTVFGLAGAKRHGKDTMAEAIKEFFPGIYLDSVASPIHRFAADNFEYTEENKEDIIPWLTSPNGNTVTQRDIQTLLGTEYGRNMIDPDLWVKLLDRRIKKVGATSFCNPSIRFENEAKHIKENNGLIIFVYRPDYPVDTSHESEKGINTGYIDEFIVNNGTVEDLKRKVTDLLRKHFS